MADRKQLEILYQSIARDLLKVKGELLNEVKFSSAQVGAMCEMIKDDKNGANAALAQELRYSYKQNQSIYQGVADMVSNDIGAKLAEINEKLATVQQVQEIIDQLNELKYNYMQLQAIYEGLSASIVADVVPKVEELSKATEEGLSVHSQKVLDAVAAIPAPEEVDYMRITDEVGDKVMEILNQVRSQVKPVEIDYDRIVNRTVEQVVQSMPYQPKPDIDMLAKAVASKIVVPTPVVTAPEIDYERLADLVAERLQGQTFAPVAAVEEEPIVEEEVAVALAPVEEPKQFVAVDNEMVDRLKRSFTAKLKQSKDEVKSYYSAIKNELTSYERINSTVSWSNDRFNYGRETVAKMMIIGTTLKLFLNLDPNDPEFKQTVYRQEDMSGQRAHAGTPFVVKVQSEGALKKALRLVGYLVEKYAAKKDGAFQPVDYAEVYEYATDDQLIDDGYIKVVKEKKVELDF